jgi:hypothetical protein
VASVVFNIAKGRVAQFAALPLANDALIVVPLQTAGLSADAVLIDDASLTGVLTHGTEQTTMGRKTATTIVLTPDYTNDRMDVDIADVTWSAATGPAVSALVVCYVPDTTAGGLVPGAYDSSVVPLTKHDFVVTPTGGDIIAQIAAAGFFRAA